MECFNERRFFGIANRHPGHLELSKWFLSWVNQQEIQYDNIYRTSVTTVGNFYIIDPPIAVHALLL